MKKLYFLFFFACSFLANAQIVNIPDANFKAKLLSASPSNEVASTETPNSNGSVSNYHTIDTNGDGEIQVSEAQAIKWLDVSSSNIFDLTGIEAFVNLQTLYCHYSQLTSLNVSQNVNLEYLYCFGNQLTSLDVSQNMNLKDLICSSNTLTSLDVSQNVNLQGLSCSFNQLTSLDVSQNVNLQNLYCHYNQLTALDVSQNVNLQELYCYYNQLTALDVSQNVNLQELYCYYNPLTSLDVSGAVNLQTLYCYYNQLTALDVSGAVNLLRLHCYFNQLMSLNLKNNNNNWQSLNFSNNPNLQYICTDEEDVAMVQNKINSYGYASTCHVNSYCSFTPGGTFYEISGNTKWDLDNNGCDANDINYPNLKFDITDGTNSGSFIANSSGNYYIPFSAGNHTMTPVLENPSYFNISPTTVTVDFPTQASPFLQDFCVTANGVHSDVEITLIPLNPARPGFDAHYKLVYKNKGNQVENGTVTFTYFQEDALDFVIATPVFDNQNTMGVTSIYTWNYTNLQPFETREINVTINLNSPMETPPLNAGDILSLEAQVTTINNDENLNDNYAAIRQEVVNSYDPNDKTCLEGEIVEPSMVGEYVHYVIRFENTGTYPAENIVVKDMIDTSKFDISTLVPLHGSHDFYTRIKDNKVEFIFENINLDFNFATNDGYVAFKIKTLPTLTVGDTFSNDANIYFDYNFPITTNTYTTTIQALANPSFTFENEFVLYPNPASSTLSIQAKNQMTIQSVEVYNLVGQLVIAVPNATQTIDVSNLETGTYFIKVNTANGNAVSKFVKE